MNENNTSKHVGLIIRESLPPARGVYGERSMTVSDVARKMGVNRHSVSRLFSGKVNLSIKMAYNLEKTFGFNAKDLLLHQLNRDCDNFLKKEK